MYGTRKENMTIRKCDRCKQECTIHEITEVNLEKANSMLFTPMNKSGLLQGTGVHAELCFRCLQKANWCLFNYIYGKYDPTNPVNE